ncbi:hypothetical protein AB0E01_03410 [Nocardia vinacea]|uniref:hypothetical protein n=1 Tax=Nocardia vinacea TaxID=96468 RepID=UPI0033C72528
MTAVNAVMAVRWPVGGNGEAVITDQICPGPSSTGVEVFTGWGLPALRGLDVVWDGLTASFEVRYVDGAEGERIAATQAKALAALLKWQADCADIGRS